MYVLFKIHGFFFFNLEQLLFPQSNLYKTLAQSHCPNTCQPRQLGGATYTYDHLDTDLFK